MSAVLVEESPRAGRIDAFRDRLFLLSGILLLLAFAYTGVFGIFEIYRQVAMVLMFLLPAAIMKRPAAHPRSGVAVTAVFCIDVVLAAVAAAAAAYIFFGFAPFYERIELFSANNFDLAVGIALGALFLEGSRRYIGLPLVVMTLLFVLYAIFGDAMPGVLRAASFDLPTFGMSVLLSSNGVFGPALRVTAVEIYAFILFGAALEAVGAGGYFMRVASALTRRSYGGPAKAAVVGSSLLGSISGSAIANVVMSGSVTIPMMKRAGFKPHVAASVEAVASSGGQIMPPIMGATAFVVAAYTGTPYGKVAMAAAIPALLFFLSIFINVHLYSLREGIRPLDQKSAWERKDLVAGLAIAGPVILLVYLLVTYFPPMLAALYSTGALLLATLPLRSMRITWAGFVQGVTSLTSAMVTIAVACGAAGIVMGIILQSGLGAQLSSVLIDVAGGNLYVLALLTALVSIVLGMGLPTIVVYILLATLIAPALIQGGFNVLAVHLFIFYYGVIALLTPPLAVASYAAAAIAQSDPTKTGFYAAWFALGKYVVPFMFLFSPALIGEAQAWLIGVKVIFATGALCAVSLAIIGHWRGEIRIWERASYLAAASLLGAAPLTVNAGGMVLLSLLVGARIISTRHVAHR